MVTWGVTDYILFSTVKLFAC